jgi:peptide/nickel transport system ATP-binding protein
MIALEVKNLNVQYHTANRKVHACSDVNFLLHEQESLGIVGESGSGKSTLALAVLRLLPAHVASISGSVLYNGVDLLSIDQKTLNDLRWKKIAIVFQKSMNSLSPVHKISKQMADIYRIHEPESSHNLIRKRIFELFTLVNLSDRVYNLYPHELSGGMMQRISIAVSLLHNPEILIMDESTTALDVVTEGQILSEIMELEKKLNLSRIMITHDISVVASTCKRIAVMYAGCMMEVGNVVDVLVNPKHPYTQALKRSFPNFIGEKTGLHGIPGTLPDLTIEAQGCVFAPRCNRATEICQVQRPHSTQIGNNWQVYCHHAGE